MSIKIERRNQLDGTIDYYKVRADTVCTFVKCLRSASAVCSIDAAYMLIQYFMDKDIQNRTAYYDYAVVNGSTGISLD